MSTLNYNFLMQFTAEALKEILKNYHIYRGRVACGTASVETKQMMERLQIALELLKYSDADFIKAYYIKREGSLSVIAKQCNCSKNNISKKLNRIIKELAEIMSDGESLATISLEDSTPEFTEKQIRYYLKHLVKDIDKWESGCSMDEDYIDILVWLRDDGIYLLDEMDRTLIKEFYVNKENLSLIGSTYGYSVSGVKYRIRLAIKKLCAIMNGDKSRFHK